MTMLGILTFTMTLLSGSMVQTEAPEALLTQGKLDADLGEFESAALSFKTVADDTDAPATLRWEALVWLGQVYAQLERHEESVAALERVMQNYSDDPEAIRFLTLAVVGVAPSSSRWEAVWRDVTLEVVRAPHAVPVIRWPGFDPLPMGGFRGDPVSLRVEDATLADILRELSEQAELSFVMYAGADGEFTASFSNTPWDRALQLVVSAAGLDVEQVGNVQIVGDAPAFERLGSARPVRASGEPMAIDFRSGDLGEVMRMFADITGLNVVVLPGVHGSVTLTLRDEPWERALFLVLNSQGLAFTRRDHVLVVGEPERLEPYIEMEARDYSGDIISIDFQGDDFDEVMRFFSDAADRQIVADARFTGALHFKLTDVPWDQALDVVLALYGLRFEAGDSALRIVLSS